MSIQFPEIIARHSKWRANETALITDDFVLSWRKFDTAINKVANGLIELGLVPGDTVGVLMTNSASMVVALFGIAKAGCCSVPLNPSVSNEALGSMLSDAAVSALFASEDHSHRLGAVMSAVPFLKKDAIFVSGTASPCWRDMKSWLETQRGTSPGQLANLDHPMNIIYSSGTTGMPKGILATFQGRLDWAYDLSIAFRFHSHSRTLIATGLYSNISWATMLSTIMVGGTIIVAPNKYDTHDTLQRIVDYHITHTAMVPVQYQRLLETGAMDSYDLSSVECAITVGAPMHVDLKKSIHRAFGGALFELYGLTEGLITVMPGIEMPERWESAGKPLQGADIQFWNDDGQEVEPGQTGEIVGHARYMMPGYHNRSADTEAAIETLADGSRWLKTGDIGFRNEEGYIYVVDRKKDMILSGGQNIYPADIEVELLKYEGVSEVAVVGAKSKRWGETPVAFIVGRQGVELDPEKLRNRVNGDLGKQQRLAAIELIDALPRNPTGKVLKRELREGLDGRIYD
jgi:acyl-CoA synthetase (AMP-forming)/AMP-acid ligase II